MGDDNSSGLMFLYEGEFLGCRKLSTFQNDTWPTGAELEPTDDLSSVATEGDDISVGSMKRRRTRFKKKRRSCRKDVYVNIARFQEGDIVGEDAFMPSESKRRYDVIVTSESATVLIASRKISRQYFSKEQQEAIQADRRNLYQSETMVRSNFEKCTRRLDKFEQLKMDSLGPNYRKRVEAAKRDEAKAKKAEATRAAAKHRRRIKKELMEKHKVRPTMRVHAISPYFKIFQVAPSEHHHGGDFGDAE